MRRQSTGENAPLMGEIGIQQPSIRSAKWFIFGGVGLCLVAVGLVIGAVIVVNSDSHGTVQSDETPLYSEKFIATSERPGVVVGTDSPQNKAHDVYVDSLGDGIHEPPPSDSPMGKYKYASVAADHPLCSKIGTDIMGKHCGSAVDAAIASLLCIGIENAHSTGIGGGSFVTIYDREKREVVSLDCREEAPSGASTNMFVNNTSGSLDGGLSIAVPAEVACYKKMHDMYGRLPWKQLFEPTIKLCREGFEVNQAMSKTMVELAPKIEKYPGMKIFINPTTREFYKEGEYMTRPKLADTLELIAEKGADEFYHGELAKTIVKEIRQAGGIVTLADMKNYKVLVKDALNVTLDNGGYTVFGPPPPSSGAVLMYILSILDGYNMGPRNMKTKHKTILTYHRIIEAFKFAYAKRSLLGDGRFVDIKQVVQNLTSKDYANYIRSKISDDKTHDLEYYEPDFGNEEDHGTSHLAVLGPDGSAVSVTSTINQHFGSKVRGSKTGIIYNDEMDDFSTPGTVNGFGIPASPANYIKPGKRPLSSMCPAVIIDKGGNVISVTGASGGSKITTSTAYNTVRNLWLGETIKEAIDYPRLHHQLVPLYIQIEKGFPLKYIEGLIEKGHNVTMLDSAGSVCQAIHDTQSGRYSIHANSDYRKGGAPDGY
ncbi:unnamed protein product [Owenia fusiformis]|uniref:Uncharacterized protein n=1 Tax=Owenia fusiformis TaxID=6347 RepID=A0A8J1UWJ3_OWEFU|nr:unnamed protein product [Owenia fusiformis]